MASRYYPAILICAAISCQSKASEIANVSSCLEIDLQNTEVGSRCTTSKGATFVRFQNSDSRALGVQDLQSEGKVWFDDVYSNIFSALAVEICNVKIGQTLPTQSDFEIAESHGFREVLKDMNNSWFYSSTSAFQEDVPRYNIYFNSIDFLGGNLFEDPRLNSDLGFNDIRARCVSRSDAKL